MRILWVHWKIEHLTTHIEKSHGTKEKGQSLRPTSLLVLMTITMKVDRGTKAFRKTFLDTPLFNFQAQVCSCCRVPHLNATEPSWHEITFAKYKRRGMSGLYYGYPFGKVILSRAGVVGDYNDNLGGLQSSAEDPVWGVLTQLPRREGRGSRKLDRTNAPDHDANYVNKQTAADVRNDYHEIKIKLIKLTTAVYFSIRSGRRWER